MTADSATGSPSKRSTARRRRRPPPRRVCSTSAFSARRSHASSGSRSGGSVLPPRSTKSAASPPSSTTVAPATRAARPVARFGQGRAAPYGWPGRRPRARAAAALRPRAPQLAQPLDRTAERELGAAETFHEVPAAAEPERLERPQLRIDGPVATGDALGPHAVAGDDPLALEQQLGQRSSRRAMSGVRPRTSRRDGPSWTSVPGSPLARLLGVARNGAAAARFSVSHNGGAPAVAARRRSSPRRPTRSQSAGSACSASTPVAARRSDQNSAERASAARIASCTLPSGRGAPPAAPSTPASSRKYTATRSRPAPIQTISPVAHSWSSCSGR